MNETSSDSGREKTWRTLLLAFSLAAGFLLWGLFLYGTIGSTTPPSWDFGVVPDVPGISFYSTGSPQSLLEQAALSPQHVQDRPLILKEIKKEAAQ